MNREFLKGLGLEDDAIDKIMAEHGKTVNATKENLESVTTERDDLKTQLSERDTQLDDLSKQVKDNKELTDEIERLKGENKEATDELQKKLDEQSFNFALERAVSNAQAKNPKAVKALLDTESIKLDGEKLLGLDDQLTALKESDAYLFGEDEPKGLKGRQPNEGSKKPQEGVITKTDISKMNYKEHLEFKQNNPEQYQKLMNGE